MESIKNNIVAEWLDSFNKSGNDELKEIFNDSLKEFPDEMAKLNTLIKSRSDKEINKLSHKIKGLYGTLHIYEIYELVNIINIESGRNSPDYKRIEMIFDLLMEWENFIKCRSKI